MLKPNEPSRLESIQSCVNPFRQWFLPWPTKGWPCEVMGPKSFARPSSLLVDPGNICPPQAPNLWVDFEIIGPKILGPACSFDFRSWMLWKSHLSNCCFWTLINPVKQTSVILLQLFQRSSLYTLEISARLLAYALEISILSLGVEEEVHPMGVAPELWVDYWK
jgi:hypothetical protein